MTPNYYQKHKEKLQKEAGKTYQNHSEERKEKDEKRPKKDIKISVKKKRKKKRQYHCERNKNLSEE